MNRVLTTVLLSLSATLSVAAPKGQLVLIGGGDHAEVAMRKIVELAGGPAAPIVIIPTASDEADSGPGYAREFNAASATNVRVLDLKTRDDAARPDFVEAVKAARVIFFGGGDQARITAALLDTPVMKAIGEAYENGAVVSGSSAGTACQSNVMITGEGDFKSIRAGAVQTARGLGLFRGVIVDQHFIKRQRQNRLFAVVLEHPELPGVGVDEDTAVWVKPDGTFEVVGAGSVMVIDAKDAHLSRAGALLGAHDLRVHVLLAGERYDPLKRAVIGGAK